MKVTREFYKLPLEEKQKYSNFVDGKEFRMEGYGSDMVISEKQIVDWCDRFYLVVEPESQRIYTLWPTQPPSFRDILSEYTAKVQGGHQPCPQEPGQAAQFRQGLLHQHAR